MKKRSAGILLFRTSGPFPEVLLVHPGGPFWKNKDRGAWSIPKGEPRENEDLLEAARREFMEETGVRVQGRFIALSPRKQKSGKMVYAWALKGEMDPTAIKSNTVELEWPPRSGKKQQFREVDKAGWFGLDEAREKIIAGQLGFIEDLEKIIAAEEN